VIDAVRVLGLDGLVDEPEFAELLLELRDLVPEGAVLEGDLL